MAIIRKKPNGNCHCTTLPLTWPLTVALTLYVIFDASLRLRSAVYPSQPHRAQPLDCQGRDAHRAFTSADEASALMSASPWAQMKWTVEAAPCPVRGHVIEKIDDANDFRRGYALKFADDVEDRTHLLSWLLAARSPSLARRRRRVLLDLGANHFRSSLAWFLRMYPLDFTEVHAFEESPRVWRHLSKSVTRFFNESANWERQLNATVRVRKRGGIGEWMMRRVRIYRNRVSDRDDNSTNSVDISRFMREELHLTAEDAVVVKMDIEGAEWQILSGWIEDKGSDMASIVDELFVEIHYSSPSMSAYGWDAFAPHTRLDAACLLADLRFRGFYAHFWP